MLAKITVVAVGPNRDASANTRIKLARVAFPLLESVVLEKELVEPPANLGNDHFLTVARRLDRNAPLRERGFHFRRRARTCGSVQELFEGIEIDRELPVTSFGPGQNLIFHLMPLRELRQILADSRRIGSEIMRAIFMEKHARSIVLVVRIAPDVRASIHDQAIQPALRREPLRQDRPGVSAADNKDVARKHAPSSGCLPGRRKQKIDSQFAL